MLVASKIKKKHGQVKRGNKKHKEQLVAKIRNTIFRHAVIKNKIHDSLYQLIEKFPISYRSRGPVPELFNMPHFLIFYYCNLQTKMRSRCKTMT